MKTAVKTVVDELRVLKALKHRRPTDSAEAKQKSTDEKIAILT